MANSLSNALSRAKSAVKGVADLPAQDVSEARDIAGKMQNIQAYKSASSVQAAPAKPAPASNLPVDRVKSGAKFGDRPGEKRIDVNKLDSYKKGGKIPGKTTKAKIVKVHGKERVLNAKQNKKFEASPMAKGLSK